ncbi:type II toxin-antitoxin system PemK/MazF family toxin [Sedimentibacter sp.]|uniref:type II toxin-antitoxin system PemK/MazF family toxin n=1 Tax=Sedimentibacter sp. TaxID=1960295 RepID=UPI0028A232A9|nr:type II toxin-antitoxin system PemK/MazF family toxin [Sedimentibacter sp.]
MVRQGDIIKLDFNPQSGHEQACYRPAVVVSNDFFNSKVNMTIVCPITNTQRPFPLHIPLDNRTVTTGVVLCEHIKALDLNSRTYKIIERIPDDILEEIISTVFSQIEK